MARHTYPKKRSDDLDFPVRVKIFVPDLGFGSMYDLMYEWLDEHADPRGYAVHPGASSVPGHVVAFHVRSAATAAAFMEAFPTLKLADGAQEPGPPTAHHSTR